MYLVHVGRNQPLKRMPYEHELEMISHNFFFLMRREAGKQWDVFAQFKGVHTYHVHPGRSSQRLKPACASYL